MQLQLNANFRSYCKDVKILDFAQQTCCVLSEMVSEFSDRVTMHTSELNNFIITNKTWCHQIFFVNNTKIFVTPSVLKLQKWFLHQNGVEFNQKSKSDDSGPLYTVTWRCLAVPELPKALLKMASCLISVISPIGHRRQLCIVLSFSYTRQRTHRLG